MTPKDDAERERFPNCMCEGPQHDADCAGELAGFPMYPARPSERAKFEERLRNSDLAWIKPGTEACAIAWWAWQAALAARDAPAGWRPIESAPKDGSEVLLWDSSAPIVAAFDAGYDKAGAWWCGECYLRRPTHWMPLPEPPK